MAMGSSSVFFTTIIHLLLFLLALLFLVVPVMTVTATNGGGASSSSSCIKSFFNFGDDISDTGNYVILNPPTTDVNSPSSSPPPPLHHITWEDIPDDYEGRPAFLANITRISRNFTDVVHDLPYGITYFNKPSGRSSNGRLIIDFMADALGLPFLHPYLAGLKPENYTKGANFAVIGAKARDPNYHHHHHHHHLSANSSSSNKLAPAPSPSPSSVNPKKMNSLRVQVDWFKDLLQSLCSNNNNSSTAGATTDESSCIQEYLKNSLMHIGGIGTYDYSLDKNKTELQAMVGPVVDEIIGAVAELYTLGAEKIMVAGLLPIGCFPSTQNYRWHEIEDENGCVFELDRIARHHNTLLQQELQTLRDWVRPEVNIIYMDYYHVASSFINSPTRYGFTNKKVKMACCEVREADVFLYDAYTESCEISNVCDKPEGYILWDQSHMTEAAYQVIASSVIAGNSSTPVFNLLSSKC